VAEEGRDNHRFLQTLERHFRTVAAGPLPEVAAALGPLLGGLRLVWAISRYYSDDMRMGALMQRIAHDVAERAERSIDVQVHQQLWAGSI
jgi:dynein heavy chain